MCADAAANIDLMDGECALSARFGAASHARLSNAGRETSAINAKIVLPRSSMTTLGTQIGKRRCYLVSLGKHGLVVLDVAVGLLLERR